MTMSWNNFDNYDAYPFDYGDEYMYPGYNFERPVYLYIWEILVIITCLQNLIVLSVFLRKRMRNPTNFILCSIAISDTMAGLVTLPAYIIVFQRYEPLNDSKYVYPISNFSHTEMPITDRNTSDLEPSIKYSTTAMLTENITQTTPMPTLPPVDGYNLTKILCRAFMISKFFLSKSFYTISVFLTLFLEIQLYISMAYPYKYEACFNRFRIVKIYCMSVFMLCPILHAFHIGSEKAIGGVCQWELEEMDCGVDCIYLWVAFILRHFIPSVTMCVFTSLFIRQLHIGEKIFRRLDSDPLQCSKRVHENRHISFVVTCIVVVRLVPEIPYSIYILYNSVDKTINNGMGIDLEWNRIIHMVYELVLIVCFIANFYFYIIFNRKFRKCFYSTFIAPLKRKFNDSLRIYGVESSSPLNPSANKRADNSCDDLELQELKPGRDSRSLRLNTKTTSL